MPLKHLLLIIFIVACWAFNAVAIKMGVSEIPPLFMTLLRFIVVAALVVPFTRIRRAQLPVLCCLAFTFGFMHFSLLFLGVTYTDAGTAAVIVQLGTPLAMILAAICYHERLNARQMSGIVLSLAGLAVLCGSPTLNSWLGGLILLISALGWAVTNVIVRRVSAIHPVTMAGWMSLLAIPIVGIMSWLFESHQLTAMTHASWRGWFAVLYSAIVCSVVAYSLWYGLLRQYPVNQIIPWSLLSPVFALLMGAVVLGDSLNPWKVTGAAIVVGGTFIALYSKHQLTAAKKLN
ncbi:multidrug DMT transporter permease [Brenneria alni]|uniref:Multidrug DMT transporter permease n=1 Tax=Brenneria alni TaxID=71656 RepID=A0A421DR25_9GAMM|nr:EamA family transporter [Brenneria alni]RLM26382.1 multidrug DMT transporter permease [Brenneria alni]